jgi:hypothetical protein
MMSRQRKPANQQGEPDSAFILLSGRGMPAEKEHVDCHANKRIWHKIHRKSPNILTSQTFSFHFCRYQDQQYSSNINSLNSLKLIRYYRSRSIPKRATPQIEGMLIDDAYAHDHLLSMTGNFPKELNRFCSDN